MGWKVNTICCHSFIHRSTIYETTTQCPVNISNAAPSAQYIVIPMYTTMSAARAEASATLRAN